MERRIRKSGNYIKISDSTGTILFNSPAKDTKFIPEKDGKVVVYTDENPKYLQKSITTTTAEFVDENGDEIVGGVEAWLEENTGFSTASGGSGAFQKIYYGTSDTPPSASSVDEGSIYIQHEA